MLTIANKGRYLVKKCQKHVYVICEGSLKLMEVVDEARGEPSDSLSDQIQPVPLHCTSNRALKKNHNMTCSGTGWDSPQHLVLSCPVEGF